MLSDKAVVKTVIINSVDKGSPAETAGIIAGDVLVSINGNPVNDVLDYRFYLADSRLRLGLMRNGAAYETAIRKSQYDDIGLEFDTPLMDKKRRCANACVFCFIDQNPQGMRETIYFKDDDSRLSFIHGNYITLTNLSDDDISRIIKMRISPVRVSVHTTDPELRVRMMKNRRAGEVLSYLDRVAAAGLELNCQIVLCRGLNDGSALDRTMSDLEKFIPSLTSVSVVPAGLTRHRNGLYPLSPFTKEESAAVISQVNGFGDGCLEKYGSRIFFCADEFYLGAGLPLPGSDYYEDFSQLENGVGMLRSFEDDFHDALDYTVNIPKRTVSVATGAAAYDTVCRLTEALRPHGLDVRVYKIKNDFYGESVTVSGLLTGRDIAAQLSGRELGDELFVPANALRDSVFLDDMTTDELSAALNVKVTPAGEGGGDFLDCLTGNLK